MTRKQKFALLVAVVGVVVTPLIPGFSQDVRKLGERFDQFDINHDGLLSGKELNAHPILKSLDLDGNESVDKKEALAAMVRLKGKSAGEGTDAPKTGVVFRAMDKNGDGHLSREELSNRQIFDKLDLDKDGVVKLAEAVQALGEILPEKYRSEAPVQEAATAEAVQSLQEQPLHLKATDHGVGRQVPAVALKDRAGVKVTHSRITLVAMFGATCPISAKLGPELARLEKEFAGKGVKVIFCDPVPSETDEEIDRFIAAHALQSAVIHDKDRALAMALGATTTTEVFVLDSARTLIYRGAVNDQYGLGYTKEKPHKHYLRDALDAALSGSAIDIAATTAPGCALDLPVVTSPKTSVTYHREVSRILQNHCIECHRSDGLGPFSLETYDDVIEHAAMIKKQVVRGAMPPWFAAKEPNVIESPWANDCSLSDRDKEDLITWLDSKRDEGDPADKPIARTWPKDWSLGQPDYIVQLPRSVSIKAEGTMPYQFITTETTLTEDKWVRGYEIIPTDRTVVHHVIVSVHPKGSRVRDRDEGTSGYWAAYVPGNSKRLYPEGFARKLPAGSTVSFQIHYTPNGRATQDQLRMGLYFANRPPQFIVDTIAVPKRKLDIPPGVANHVEVETRTVPFDLNAMAFMAHMHVRGKAFKYELVKADGTTEILLDIPRYDFNWQLRYDLAKHQTLRRGDTLKITAVYDNSTGNPANPDPTRTVKWGPQTADEMMIGYIEHFKPAPQVEAQARVTP